MKPQYNFNVKSIEVTCLRFLTQTASYLFHVHCAIIAYEIVFVRRECGSASIVKILSVWNHKLSLVYLATSQFNFNLRLINSSLCFSFFLLKSVPSCFHCLSRRLKISPMLIIITLLIIMSRPSWWIWCENNKCELPLDELKALISSNPLETG